MRPAKYVSLRKNLVRRMIDLRISTSMAIASMKNSGDRSADLCDQAATESYMFHEAVCRNRERRAMLDLLEAIRRIDAGSFGVCVFCGNPIPRKRIALVPLSRTCLSCQQNMEMSLGQSKSGE